MAATSVPLGLALSSSHALLASRDLDVFRTSKAQARIGWRAASGARAMSSEGTEGASRREVTVAAFLAGLSLATTVGFGEDAEAVSSSRRALRSELVPESDYKTLPNGLKYYDVKVGGGKAAEKGSRVAVHYVAKWKGLTFMTSRQGMGVTGGTPYGFDIGASEYGIVLKGLDYGVEGMRVGGQRLLIVPPELAYGNKGVQEIPPNATLQFDVELLSIKQDNFGSRVKVVEG
ncbi:hypothetical protein M758_2G033100 [Ceratodon purpureus]|nr:hypothetical protein M758_2G033100 [Ceratodon purpureus]